jgi:two-component system response regulator RegA
MERKRLRILVVDDNLDQVHTMAYLLRDLGHHVDFAINGLGAIDLAQRMVPDVVLLDMRLGDTTGLNIARDLRRNAQLVRTTIVGITGFPVNRSEAAGAGFDDLLRKPVDLRELTSILARL